jgi:glycerophosphoryl diester phosphodiesterase
MTAVFAHRGCTDGFVENSLEAFMEARRLGADGVELDVRLTADAALAVHHDPTLDGLGPVAALSVPELPDHVPLLADALAVCEGMVVNVEIKNEPAETGHADELVAEHVARIIDEAGWTDRVIVSSFGAGVLHAVGRVDSRLALGLLWPPLTDARLALPVAVTAGWQAIHPFVTEISPELVEGAHRAGLAVNVWTVNAAHDLTAFVALGVDTVITDRLAEGIAIARGSSGGSAGPAERDRNAS